MSNRLEKKVSVEKQNEFRKSLIDLIIERSLPEIMERTTGRNILNRDISNVLRPILDQYRQSSATRIMSGTVRPEDWESFENEVNNQIGRKLSEMKSKEPQETEKMEKIKKPLEHFHQRTLFPMSGGKRVKNRKLS